MSSEESIPHLLYQSVLLEPLPDATELKSTTTLWIGYKTSIKEGSKLYLHCRQCKIEEISINSVKCDFVLNDGLRMLSSNKKQTYLSEEMDLNYRAALEISRLGELEITIPDLSGSKTDLPVPLPRPCPRDVIGRYDKVVKTYKSLVAKNSPRYREQGPDCSPLGMADPTNPNENTEENHLLQVKIVYSLSGSTSYAGVVFRQPSPLAKIYEPKQKDRQQRATQSKSEEESSPVCIHSTSFTTGSLRDVDGIRCWLPCMDSLDQRAVYDISIVAPRHWRVACCGKKVSTFLLAPPDNPEHSNAHTHGERKITRFFTPNRIPAMSVGFYLGAVEMYKMPLYKVRSRLWVSLGLQDFVSTRNSSRRQSSTTDNLDGGDTGNDETDDESGSFEDEEDGNKVFLRPLDDSYYSAFKRTLPTQTSISLIKDENEDNIVYKKLKTNTGSISIQQQQNTSKKQKSQNIPGIIRSKLYERKVTHSTLGLDISLRLLHKFTGHKYDYDEFVFIFVYDLGTDFIAYDGFTLVDARILHNESEVQMETPTHLMLLQAYLYSWLKSSLPVSAYDVEFILHGTVGYLLNFYAEEVYGEEDGRYRYQKMYDTVLSLEKQGQAFPLSSFFPEQYESFGLHYGVYLKCKSAVIFQLIENRVGGKEDMRIAIKQLIRSPPIYTPVNKPYKGANTDIVSNFQSLFETTGNMSPMSPNQTPPTPSMVNQALALNEERRQYRSYSEDGSYGGMSPYSAGNRSPSTYAGNMSPMSMSSGNVSPYYNGYQGNISPYQGGNISPYPYNRAGNISPYQGGNLSPYTGQGNMSPYAPYAMGAATPAYDAYAHTTRLGKNADTQALTYSPSRYELSHSPIVTSGTDATTEKTHLLAPVPSTHFETETDNTKAVETETGTEAVAETNSKNDAEGLADSASSIVETEANEGSIAVSNTDTVGTTEGSGGGASFYAAMAQRRERADSLSLAAAVTTVNTSAVDRTKQTQPEPVADSSIVVVPTPSNTNIPTIPAPPLRIELNRQGSIGSATGSATGFTSLQRDWSMLTFDCVTAESFILTVRHASGASADIDDDFLDRFVYNKGALFLRVYVTVSEKIEAKPRQISIFSQQIGHKDHDNTGKPVFIKDNLKVRIAEVRDDVVTEPYVMFCNKEEEFIQQAYTRPGRRGGKRRGPGKKAEDSEELTPQQRDEITRKNREKEERKSSLLKARDLDYPLRYVVVDPHCQQIIDIYNSSTDIILVEQLYTDFFENSVYFQCQALRSLARAGTSTATIATDISTEAAACLSGLSIGEGLGSSFGFSSEAGVGSAPVRIPEKSTHLQLKALSDCVLGAATMINDPKMLSGSQFSTFVRCEAAIALAHWQNERAPRTVATDISVTDSWQALHILNQHLHSLFADPDSLLPLPSDLSNESSTHLRNAMLLAIATVKAKSGGSPEVAVDTILKFANAGVEAEVPTDSPQTTALEDGHYRAVLFYTLSQLRFESLALSKGSTMHPIYEIGTLAMSTVSAAFTRARATARMKYTRGAANLLPSLSSDGIDVAAAIACLAAIDQHTVNLYAKGRAPPTSHLVYGNTVTGHSLKDVDRNGPSGRGPFSGLNYVKHFLPAEARLHCLVEDNTSTMSTNTTHIKDKVVHLLCTPVVRAAAFEGFIRLCFAMQYSHEERLRAFNSQHNTSSDHTSNTTGINTTYIPAAVEALNAVLKYDPSAWVRQQAAFTFTDVVMDRPPRIMPQALSLGSYWNCLAWSDPWATTLPQHLGGPAVGMTGSFLSNAVVRSGKECLQQGGKSDYTLIAMKLLWKHILSSMNYDQPVRQALLTVWKYCFEGRVPPVLTSSSSAADGRVADRIFGSVLPMDRLTVRNPNDEAQKMENLLKNGTNKAQRTGRASMDSNTVLTAAEASFTYENNTQQYAGVEQPFPALQRQVSADSSSAGGGLRLSLSMNRPKTASGEGGDTTSNTTTNSTGNIAAGEKRPTFKFVI